MVGPPVLVMEGLDHSIADRRRDCLVDYRLEYQGMDLWGGGVAAVVTCNG